jgi:hypothetical protein
MENKNSAQLLRNPEQEPGDRLFREILSEQLYQTYEELLKIVSEMGLSYEWRFYNDGKAWLCKITHKKKTVAWLSLWENTFKTGFYFTEKTSAGIMSLDVDDKIKSSFSQNKPIGKLFPLALEINRKNKLDDFRKIAAYKMSLK